MKKAGYEPAFLLAYLLRYCLLLDQSDIIVPLWRGVRVV